MAALPGAERCADPRPTSHADPRSVLAGCSSPRAALSPAGSVSPCPSAARPSATFAAAPRSAVLAGGAACSAHEPSHCCTASGLAPLAGGFPPPLPGGHGFPVPRGCFSQAVSSFSSFYLRTIRFFLFSTLFFSSVLSPKHKRPSSGRSDGTAPVSGAGIKK